MSLQFLAAGLMSHVTNSEDIHVGPWNIPIHAFNAWMKETVGFSPHLNKHVIMMMVSATLVALVTIYAARRATVNEGKGLVGHAIESTAVFLRDQVVRPGVGEHHAHAYFPLFATFFFFILANNLVGLLPPPLAATATGNWNVTAALALMTLATMIIGGMVEKGPLGFFTGLVPHGVAWWMWPLVFLIEIVGLLTKPFALMVRLFANMTAGHVILAVLAMFLLAGTESANAGETSFAGWLGLKVLVAPATLGFALFINVFEVLVAFIQAYIFTTLSSIFVGLCLSHDH